MRRVYTDHALFSVGPAGARVLETWGCTMAELSDRLPLPLASS